MAETIDRRTPVHRRVMQGALRPLMISSSLPQIQLDWRSTSPEKLDWGPDPVVFHTKLGDPEAALLPRGRDTVGILAVSTES